MNVAKSNPSEKSARQTELQSLINDCMAVRDELKQLESESSSILASVDVQHRQSARNLIHYLALRQRDRRQLQDRLTRFGLSSLGRTESHVLATFDAVLSILHDAVGQVWRPPAAPGKQIPVDFEEGRRLLEKNADALLGPEPSDRPVRIMVTMPAEAADHEHLIHDLLQHGMDCMRINCAHDDQAVWTRMIERLRQAEKALGRKCRLLMDLGGPKVRTGPIEPGPAVRRFKAERDDLGQVIEPARIWLHAPGASLPVAESSDGSLLVPKPWLKLLLKADKIDLVNASGRARFMKIEKVTRQGCLARSQRTIRVIPGTVLKIRRKHRSRKFQAVVGELPLQPWELLLNQGDLLLLTRDLTPGKNAVLDARDQVISPASIGCTAPEIFDDVHVGQSLWLDDGKIGAVIESKEADCLHLRITRTLAKGAKLGSDKGINLPESKLRLSAMTARDLQDLPFVATHADMIALSFVNQVSDIRQLHEKLDSLGLGDARPAVVLKIETRRGFENLPQLLLEAMKAPNCGVMIARGDLAVECGFERLAEVQEEILWLCESAHVPVIWATQVLESLAKQGLASRAEISDAAMGHRAECVMLNKGPYIGDAVHALDDILRRMHGHQSKKRSMLRQLKLAAGFGHEEH